jgi:hypothetical protein
MDQPMSPLAVYVEYLMSLASHNNMAPTPPTITNPTNFLQAIFRILDLETKDKSQSKTKPKSKPNREGVERLIDTLFAHPGMEPLLNDVAAAEFQRKFVSEHLPLCGPLFASYWTHIILPAWSQLRDVYRTMAWSYESYGTNESRD